METARWHLSNAIEMWHISQEDWTCSCRWKGASPKEFKIFFWHSKISLFYRPKMFLKLFDWCDADFDCRDFSFFLFFFLSHDEWKCWNAENVSKCPFWVCCLKALTKHLHPLEGFSSHSLTSFDFIFDLKRTWKSLGSCSTSVAPGGCWCLRSSSRLLTQVYY